MDVAIQVADGVEVPFDDTWFDRIADAAVVASGRPRDAAEIAVLLADDAALQELNRRFRGKNTPTDVLSFEGEAEGMHEGPRHVGDIAISIERARRQAIDYQHSFERELAYLFTHGILHLLGFDHEEGAQLAVMRDAEERALAQVGLAREVNL